MSKSLSRLTQVLASFRSPTRHPAHHDGAAAAANSLALALQGGGSFGAFTWGVLDRLLEEENVAFDGVSGTSAGAVNAVALASGLVEGGRAGARRRLESVWQRISKAAALAGLPAQSSLLSAAVELSTRFLSPYQFNPLAHNPLGDVLAAEIDFERLRRESPVQLIIAATAVRDGRPRYFVNHEITLEAVLASACVPSLHQAVQIDGEWYWDGGFTANPPLVSLARLSQAQDLLLVQIIPGEDASLPTSSSQILRRVQQIAFNAPLRKELEQLVGMKELMLGEKRWASREELRRLQRLRLHRIVAENEVEGLAQASAMDLDWRFLTRLRDGGRSAADKWLRARHQSARPTHGSVPHIPLPPIGREEHES